MVNRKKLLDSLNMVKPALAVKDYIPILTYFMFDDGSVTAYNDIQAINVESDVDVQGCIPAELLIKSLGSMTAEQVEFKRVDNHVLLISGKTKIKLPVLPVEDYPTVMQHNKKELGTFKITEEMLTGIKKCLAAASNDPQHPSHMGITLEPMYSADEIALYSTDNVTISCYIVRDKDTLLPDDKPLILPLVFCQQLILLSKITMDIEVGIYSGSLVARFEDKAVLFTKTLADVNAINFMDVVSKYINPTQLTSKLQHIPDVFEQSIDRAVLMQNKEDFKTTSIVIANRTMTLESISKFGEATDDMPYAGDDIEINIDPSLVKRVLPIASKMAMFRKVMVLTDENENYIHLIAYRAS